MFVSCLTGAKPLSDASRFGMGSIPLYRTPRPCRKSHAHIHLFRAFYLTAFCAPALAEALRARSEASSTAHQGYLQVRRLNDTTACSSCLARKRELKKNKPVFRLELARRTLWNLVVGYIAVLKMLFVVISEQRTQCAFDCEICGHGFDPRSIEDERLSMNIRAGGSRTLRGQHVGLPGPGNVCLGSRRHGEARRIWLFNAGEA